jgi:ribokinase
MKVIVIGNCTVDLSFAVPRFPLAGETLLATERSVDLGGKGANQALVAERFGALTILAAPIGRDIDGDWACERLAAEGLSLVAVTRVDTATDQSVVYVTPDGENAIVSTHQAARTTTPAWAAEVLRRHAEPRDLLLLQGNLALETTREALIQARAAGMMTVLNPAPIQYSCDTLFPFVDLAILNEIEAVELGGASEPVQAGASIQARWVPQVIVTLGGSGAVLIDRDGVTRVPAPAVEAVDTVGAGDTLCGALVAALARDLSVAAALHLAVEAASLAVTRKGTQSSFPSRSEARAINERHA